MLSKQDESKISVYTHETVKTNLGLV